MDATAEKLSIAITYGGFIAGPALSNSTPPISPPRAALVNENGVPLPLFVEVINCVVSTEPLVSRTRNEGVPFARSAAEKLNDVTPVLKLTLPTSVLSLIGRTPKLPVKSEPVSYTHLTLPTICSV